jgi:putative hemolysin
MEAYQSEQNQDVLLKDIDGLIRKATFIPETRRINVLFKHMQSEKIHMAIVIDEYGQTAGIVAMEDILEEIVGNILDEYDDEELNIVSRQDGSYIVKGITPLEEISDVIGIAYPDEYDTLNGFLTAKLQRILSGDERPEVVADGVTYRILGVQNKMISLVQIIK